MPDLNRPSTVRWQTRTSERRAKALTSRFIMYEFTVMMMSAAGLFLVFLADRKIWFHGAYFQPLGFWLTCLLLTGHVLFVFALMAKLSLLNDSCHVVIVCSKEGLLYSLQCKDTFETSTGIIEYYRHCNFRKRAMK